MPPQRTAIPDGRVVKIGASEGAEQEISKQEIACPKGTAIVPVGAVSSHVILTMVFDNIEQLVILAMASISLLLLRSSQASRTRTSPSWLARIKHYAVALVNLVDPFFKLGHALRSL